WWALLDRGVRNAPWYSAPEGPAGLVLRSAVPFRLRAEDGRTERAPDRPSGSCARAARSPGTPAAPGRPAQPPPRRNPEQLAAVQRRGLAQVARTGGAQPIAQGNNVIWIKAAARPPLFVFGNFAGRWYTRGRHIGIALKPEGRHSDFSQ